MKTKTKTNRRDAEARRLAKRIARKLFTTEVAILNGTGRLTVERVKRLVVERQNEKLSGGYCEEAVADIIEKFLLRASAPRRLEGPFTEEELKALALVFGYLENDLGERRHYELGRHKGHIWLQIEKAKAAVERVSNETKGKA